jgi:hypothetical protein
VDAEEPAGKLGDEAGGFLQVEANLIVDAIRSSTQCVPTPKDGVDAEEPAGKQGHEAEGSRSTTRGRAGLSPARFRR